MDIKKLGRIPAGGGWRAHGRGNVSFSGSWLRVRRGSNLVHADRVPARVV
jgi:hypothetical protein